MKAPTPDQMKRVAAQLQTYLKAPTNSVPAHIPDIIVWERAIMRIMTRGAYAARFMSPLHHWAVRAQDHDLSFKITEDMVTNTVSIVMCYMDDDEVERTVCINMNPQYELRDYDMFERKHGQLRRFFTRKF